MMSKRPVRYEKKRVIDDTQNSTDFIHTHYSTETPIACSEVKITIRLFLRGPNLCAHLTKELICNFLNVSSKNLFYLFVFIVLSHD